jgi:hypothetical protein
VVVTLTRPASSTMTRSHWLRDHDADAGMISIVVC